MKYLTLAHKQSERFWSKVHKTRSCWFWRGAVDKDGYGKFQITTHSRPKQIHVRAHRLAYELKHGAVDPALVVMHKCDVPNCVRPKHLRPGTQAENRADCGQKGRNAMGERNGAHTHPEARPRGEKHYKATVTLEQVRRIRALKRVGGSVAAIARAVGCSYVTAWGIVSGRTWKGMR